MMRSSPVEVSAMHAREIDGNWWTIPAERSKNKKAHRAFLTPLAKRLIGKPAGYVFPARGNAEKPIGRISATNAVSPPHDLRRTVATHMPRIHTSAFCEHRDAVLNHLDQRSSARCFSLS